MVPGGRVVLFSVIDGAAQTEHVDALDLKTRRRVRVVDAGSEPRYLPPAYLLFARGRNLMATAFDSVGLETSGEAVTVQSDVQRLLIGNPLIYDVSPNGTLAYVPFAGGDQRPNTFPPVFVDRTGAVVGQIQGPVEQPIALDLSPDGQRLAVVGMGAGNNPLWIYDLRDRPPLRLTDRGLNDGPLWSRDGRTVMFNTNVTGTFDIYTLPSDGSVQQAGRFGGAPPPAIKGIATRSPEDWLPDGRLVFSESATGNGNQADLFASASPQGPGPTDLVRTSFGEYGARVSPDGRWLAFVSDRSGEPEVWVQPVSGGAALRVSRAGGVQPLWSRNGRELFYRQGPAVMAVAIQPSNDFQFAPAMKLFERECLLGVGTSPRTWDVTADGRFIMIPMRPPTTTPPQTGIVVVQNFSQEVKRLLDAK
jgi:dipeptidyl aminopeptidase/acylaminoacyl peptidase